MSTTTEGTVTKFNVKEYAIGGIFNRGNFSDGNSSNADNIKEIFHTHKPYEIYQSHFCFSKDLTTYFASHLNDKGKNTVKGYSGVINASEIILDIDSADLTKAHDDARKILNKLEKDFFVDLSDVNVNFSGSKGFHIRIPSALFGGFTPSANLNKTIKAIALKLTNDLVDIDNSIYDKTRLVRVVNTRNKKSGLNAIPLTIAEVQELSIEQIKEMAVKQRVWSVDEKVISAVPSLVSLKESCLAPTQHQPTPPTKKQKPSVKIVTIKSTVEIGDEEFDIDSEITLANGTVVNVKDTSGHQSIFCPFCDPNKRSNPNSANAFINKNSSDTYYIYCSSESKTFWQKSSDRTGIFEANGNTYRKTIKRGKEWSEIKLSSFVIKPKELLVMDDGDSLKCDVVTSKGYKYENILIENKDWHSKSKLLSAIGHQDCTFLGSDNDVQILCNMVNDNIPIRKTGTKAIGLHNDTWVIDNCNITSKGIVSNPTIMPNEKGADAFYKKIIYPKIEKQEEKELIAGFYENILKINNLETILPFVSWSFISPLKPMMMKTFGGFPHLFVHGAQGSGKTSTAISQMRLYGYNSDSPYSCTMRLFPMLKLMSSSTSVPIVFDEFKKSDMTDFEMNNMLRFMRKAYTGETESKGRADQTIIDYKITAPMIVMGEWNIIQL